MKHNLEMGQLISFISFIILGFLGFFGRIYQVQSTVQRGSQMQNTTITQSTEKHYGKGSGIQHLDLEPGSVFMDEILSITHHYSEKTIKILFKRKRCSAPVIRGRLSGPGLALLTWTLEGDTARGIYEVSKPGIYFLELVALFCEQFSRSMSSDDIKSSCLEDVRRHRLISKGSRINIIKTSKLPEIGAWETRGGSARPLFTRIQPYQCKKKEYKGKLNTKAACKEFMSLKGFSKYKFSFTSRKLSMKAIKTSLSDKMQRKFCFVGASHSRTIVKFLQDIFPSHSTKFLHLDVQWPHELSDAATAVVLNRCDAAIVGLGQWSAGWPQGFPISFEEYERSMRTALILFRNVTTGKSKVFIRSMHENPLGYMIASCPPTDWRNPEVVRIYNQILSQISNELGIKFLNTESIISPMWDSAPDWCHYNNSAGMIESLYLVHEILEDSV